MRRELVIDASKCKCWNCGHRFPYFGEESPMLRDEIWEKIAKDEPQVQYYKKDGETWIGGGFLCKDCMEKRLGRSLTFDDLKDAELGHPVPFNKYFVKKYFPEHSGDYKDINII